MAVSTTAALLAVGGGLGTVPHQAKLFDAFLPEENVSQKPADVVERIQQVGTPVEAGLDSSAALSRTEIQEAVASPAAAQPVARASAQAIPFNWPWRSLAALVIALAAQVTFEPPRTDAAMGLFFYAISAAVLGWAIWSKEWRLPLLYRSQGKRKEVLVRLMALQVKDREGRSCRGSWRCSGCSSPSSSPRRSLKPTMKRMSNRVVRSSTDRISGESTAKLCFQASSRWRK